MKARVRDIEVGTQIRAFEFYEEMKVYIGELSRLRR